jgi:hypothetical protein
MAVQWSFVFAQERAEPMHRVEEIALGFFLDELFAVDGFLGGDASKKVPRAGQAVRI